LFKILKYHPYSINQWTALLCFGSCQNWDSLLGLEAMHGTDWVPQVTPLLHMSQILHTLA